MNLAQITAQFVGASSGPFGLMNRRDLTNNPTLVSNFLLQAHMRINRELRCPANEAWVNYQITAPYNGLSIPQDYLELIGLYPNCDWAVRCKRDKLERVMNYAKFATDKSLLYARQGPVWILGPAPKIGDVITLAYYNEVPLMVKQTDTNVIATIAWDLYLYAALTFACDYFKDGRRDGFEARYTQILGDLNAQAEDDEIDEAQVQPAFYYPDDDTDNYWIWCP